MDHFVTLFDSMFLPMGLNLYVSLKKNSPSFKLWVLCLDDQVYETLIKLQLPDIGLIKLEEIETPELLKVKSGRSRAEYCWTLTPFTFTCVFSKDTTVQQITYVDADLYFFGNPRILIDEMVIARKDVLITEHAYDPQYDASANSGRFCVQFLTVNNTSYALSVIKWWQERCIEWCFCKFEIDRFGDQKYLDKWPMLFGETVHIVQAKHRTLAPWNAAYFSKRNAGEPVFFHYHGLRILHANRIRLYYGFYIGNKAQLYYDRYVESMNLVVGFIDAHGIIRTSVSKAKNPEHFGKRGIFSLLKCIMNVYVTKIEKYVWLTPQPVSSL